MFIFLRNMVTDLNDDAITLLSTKIRSMKKFLISFLGLLMISPVVMQARSGDYRDKGYKGNVWFTNQGFVLIGLDTSHGYMLNRHHYIGGGFGAFAFPNDLFPTCGNVFADYHGYILDRKSTPLAGIRVGILHDLNFEKIFGMKYRSSITLEPSLGWTWGLRSGYGLTLNVSANLVFPLGMVSLSQMLAIPKLSFGFEF